MKKMTRNVGCLLPFVVLIFHACTINGNTGGPVASTEKEMTYFSFLAEDNGGFLLQNLTGEIEGQNITVYVPVGGIYQSSLVAHFVSTGVAAYIDGVEQTSRTTAADFTNPVTYTIRAEDGTEQEYVVTIVCEGITITPEDQAEYLLQALVVPYSGITITDVSLYASTGQCGIVAGGKGLSNGVILTNGLAVNALPPNDSTCESSMLNEPGNSLCSLLTAPYGSNDSCWFEITFDLASGYNGICLEYVFGSEEYPESIDSINDACGIFLNGTTLEHNVALDPEGNHININGPFFHGDAVMLPPENGLEYDGSTPRWVAQGFIAAGSYGNKLIIVVCDASDCIGDSGIILSRLRGIPL
ncbi:MAG: choice-of-anchor L domain-containing protein [Spirochaetales bacterium]|nr:choice-of-anchor L domain-containing protein [Spirochaetales bacterium]